ncbi:MAG: cytidylate kinase-like family protein [Sulfuricellaceae bacterium]
MPTDVQAIIQALVKAQLVNDTYDRGEKLQPVVALSRGYGCGGGEIARELAKRLQVGFFDKEVLNEIVAQSGGDKYLLEKLDENVKNRWEAWILSFLSGDNVLTENYQRLLVNVLLGILDTGGVIMGRGAHIILAKHEIFRVRIIGSPEKSAKRVAASENLSLEEARKKVDEKNHERSKFVWDYWKHRLSDPTEFDLVINTDRFNDMSQVAGLIIDAMHYAGIKTVKQAEK